MLTDAIETKIDEKDEMITYYQKRTNLLKKNIEKIGKEKDELIKEAMDLRKEAMRISEENVRLRVALNTHNF